MLYEIGASKLMKSNCLFLEGQTMNRNEKITILSFDETYVSHKICYDKQNEQIIGPHRSVQTVMARG